MEQLKKIHGLDFSEIKKNNIVIVSHQGGLVQLARVIQIPYKTFSVKLDVIGIIANPNPDSYRKGSVKPGKTHTDIQAIKRVLPLKKNISFKKFKKKYPEYLI